jgi:uncharacterized membrane protein
MAVIPWIAVVVVLLVVIVVIVVMTTVLVLAVRWKRNSEAASRSRLALRRAGAAADQHLPA